MVGHAPQILGYLRGLAGMASVARHGLAPGGYDAFRRLLLRDGGHAGRGRRRAPRASAAVQPGRLSAGLRPPPRQLPSLRSPPLSIHLDRGESLLPPPPLRCGPRYAPEPMTGPT